jgi:hypothetical protein
MARVRFPAVQDFSLVNRVQTDPAVYPAFYPMGSGGCFLVGKAQAREVGHSPPSSAEVKKGGAKPPFPHMSSWHSASLIKHRDKFTLPLGACFESRP